MSGKAQSITIRATDGLNEEEVKRLIRDAEAHKKEDAESTMAALDKASRGNERDAIDQSVRALEATLEALDDAKTRPKPSDTANAQGDTLNTSADVIDAEFEEG